MMLRISLDHLSALVHTEQHIEGTAGVPGHHDGPPASADAVEVQGDPELAEAMVDELLIQQVNASFGSSAARHVLSRCSRRKDSASDISCTAFFSSEVCLMTVTSGVMLPR